MNIYGVLKNCGRVIVICKYKGSVVDVYGNNKRRMRVDVEKSERNKGM
jgi:hypothetical protein